MTTARPADYWLSNTALYIQLNAVGDCNYIHANCSAGSMVMAYMKGIDGMGYDNAHNYRRWPLIASPTVFHDNNARYVFIAISKSEDADAQAMVVFPSEMIDIYGKNEAGTQVGSTDYYFIFTQGIISAPKSSADGAMRREWQQAFDSGKLASDEAIASGGEGSWWEWNAATDMVKFLKTISQAVFEKLEAKFASITQLVLNGSPLNSVAGDNTKGDAPDAVVTPAYAGKEYLSKTHDDVAQGSITFNNTITVKGETLLKEKTTIGEYEKDIQVGIGSKQGVLLTPNGDIIARSLELSESLNVPTIKYNQIEVLSGTRWDSAGKGRVRDVISTDDKDHTCTFVLDLNEGEPGEFEKDDILRGFWHNLDGSKNAAVSSDDRRGNIQRAGFMSIYARVLSVADVVERTANDITVWLAKDKNYKAQDGDIIHANGLVKVQMRQFTEQHSWSPYPAQWSVLSQSGSFSADPNKKDRQRFTVYTTSYIARFEGVNTWEWEDGTFKGGWGDLTGFSMMEINEEGEVTKKTFTGSGFVDENIYYYGVLEQFYRFSDNINIILSRPDGTIAEGETLRAEFVLKDVQGNIIEGGYKMTVSRQSGDADKDSAWDAAMAEKYPDGIPSALEFVFADLPQNGAVYVIGASRDVPSPQGGYTHYSTSASFVLSRAYAQEVFMGPWSRTTKYERTDRTYPTVTNYGCKWYLKAQSDIGTEPLPYSSVWGMVYGVEDLTIRFYNKADQLITSAACYPGNVNIFLSPHLFCGNIDITELTEEKDWSWTRYTGQYGEEKDTREEVDRQADLGWPNGHPANREITILNEDMPPLWGSDGKVINFIVAVKFDGEEIENTVSL